MSRPPLPMSLISGYLGAGKTTLINALLAEPNGLRITVLVNDFGEIALDEDLIVNRTGDTVALANGCVCCTIGGDLYDALDRILEADERPDHLVLETSGIADPGKIAQIALAEPDLALGCMAVLADTVNFAGFWADPLLKDSLERQLRSADLIVLTKSDLADAATAAETEALIAKIAPDRPRLTPVAGNLGAEILLEDFASIHQQPTGAVPAAPHPHYASWCFSGDAPVDIDRLRSLFEDASAGILRLKGFAAASATNQAVEINAVGRQWRSAPAAGTPGNRLVAIGIKGRLAVDRLEAVVIDEDHLAATE